MPKITITHHPRKHVSDETIINYLLVRSKQYNLRETRQFQRRLNQVFSLPYFLALSDGSPGKVEKVSEDRPFGYGDKL
jgi:hypothetical protein